jgi:hypothetical protein
MHIGFGEIRERVGILEGGIQWSNGEQGEQFTDNLGPRWTIPVTTGGCQVSRKKGASKGDCSKGSVHM